MNASSSAGGASHPREPEPGDGRSPIDQVLARMLDDIDVGFLRADSEGRIVQMNAACQVMTGWSGTEATGRPLADVLAPADAPADAPATGAGALTPQAAMQGLCSGAASGPCRWVAQARDGGRPALEGQASLIHDEHGAITGMLAVMREVNGALHAQREARRLAALVESSGDAIVGKTLDGRITSWNAGAELLFGYRADEAIGQPVQMLIPPDRQEEEMLILANLTRGIQVPAFDTVRRRKDGRLIDVSIAISPILDAAGRVIGASKIARDATERKQAEQARLRAQRLESENRRIEEASRMKSRFLASMSHELRTPLNAIIGFADVLLAGRVAPDAPRYRTFLGHIATSGRHLLGLINNVLDLAKVESGKFEFFPEPLDLAALIAEVTDGLQTTVDDRHIDLTVRVDPAVQSIELDPSRLKQVLYNFLSNAIKFTPVHGRVDVSARPEGADRFRIEVADNGPGIAPEHVTRLFNDFEQLDGAYGKRPGGTGLGLALTRRLVEAQGGAVGVHSQPGQGSVFHAVLPRRHRGEPGPDIRGPAEPSARRVLVIEDDPQAQAALAQGLVTAGFEVEAVAHGERALALARDGGFDALTLDLRLPDQGGLTLLSHIRHATLGAEAPVVGLTVPVEGRSAAFAITDVLGKPLRTREIVAAMAPLRRPGHGRPTVAVIDDDPLALDLMHAALDAIGIDAACWQDARAALREMATHRPQAIILDLLMPEFDGFATLHALQRMPQWADTPVYIWTALHLTEDEYASLTRSAAAVHGKGGGMLGTMLERLQRWRPPMAPAASAPQGG